MTSSTNKPCIIALAATLALSAFVANADFDEATKAYLLGEFEKARYEALIAATDGNPKAQMLLGQLYYNGEGVQRDIPHALHWYNKAAENGFADAQYRLGILYHDGKPGIEKNLDIAYEWLMKAAENDYADAREKLQWLHKTEQGNVVNLNENVEVLKQVAASGNQQARFLLSEKLLKGTGVAQDKVGAVTMLKDDAAIGFVKAQKQLGELFFYGDGVEKDYIEAYAWSMAYAGTKELGGIAREGKQVARSALRKLPEEEHEKAYIKSAEYFEKYVLPFHKNAREVGPDKYRIVVRSQVKKDKDVAGQQAVKAQVAKKPAAIDNPSTNKSLPGVSQLAVNPKLVANVSDSASDAKLDDNRKPPASKVKSQAEQLQETSQGREVSGDASQGNNTAPAKVGETGSGDSMAKPNPALGGVSTTQPPSESASQEIAPENLSSPLQKENEQDQLIISQNSEGEAKHEKPAQISTENESVAASVTPETVKTGPVASREDMEVIPARPLDTTAADEVNKSDVPVLSERKFEEVYNVLVRKKSALQNIYAREYELDKKLEGRIVFEIVIAPTGNISLVEIVSNTLESPTLEQEFIDFLKTNVTFAPQEVADYKITYPVDFLPPQ